MGKFWPLTVALVLLTLTGCSSSPSYEVTRFHSLPAPQKQTIEVSFWDPELKRSIEYGQYAELVGQYLGSVGYRPPEGRPTDLIARIGFANRPIDTDGDVDDGKPHGSISIGVGSGGGYHHSGVGVGVGVGFPLGERKVRTEYVRIFTLDILRRSDGVKLYEGRARSEGRDPLTNAIPNLIEALFQNFPGESGQSDKITLDR
ncbi:DUF4136 domain-containing protein [Paremcibacter congregatus]|uniref:DUF4136 domain-containing protein n=1 Tax=Paremcibacter congregatus TaxID=2043170 RepID=A0A2G4YX03_9PROT|nr:DUF4136 domain-containing protein [Paremcibacter congregatus]PHZ85966.1 hypothetical protein CRD36_04645 [Paremcibacter congregatus]QDE26931.1 DUF4136 domain-containing protein [Paremcibacter congregatus]